MHLLYHTVMLLPVSVIVHSHKQNLTAITFQRLHILFFLNLSDRASGRLIIFQFHHDRRFPGSRQRQENNIRKASSGWKLSDLAL